MRRRAFLASVLATGAAGCGFRPFGGFEPFSFILIADPQMGFVEGGDGSNFSYETAILEYVVAEINRMRPTPAFIAVCGDMTNIPGYAAQIVEYKRIMGGIDRGIPIFPLSGNHDLSPDLSAESIAAYRRTYGPDRYAFQMHDWWFIVLNSTLLQLPDSQPAELAAQTAWLRKMLETTSQSRGTIVFMHHPFTGGDITGGPGTSTIGRTYLDLFAERHVAAVFNGHTHRTVPERTYRGVRLINSDGLCRSFNNKPGLRVVSVTAHGIRTEFYPPDSLPERIGAGAEQHLRMSMNAGPTHSPVMAFPASSTWSM
jgi:3',5'-cyclic AMP phosphodiesterase CpdA